MSLIVHQSFMSKARVKWHGSIPLIWNMPVVSVVAHVRQVVDNAGFQSRPIYVHIGRYDPFVSFARVALDVRNGERPWRKRINWEFESPALVYYIKINSFNKTWNIQALQIYRCRITSSTMYASLQALKMKTEWRRCLFCCLYVMTLCLNRKLR